MDERPRLFSHIRVWRYMPSVSLHLPLNTVVAHIALRLTDTTIDLYAACMLSDAQHWLQHLESTTVTTLTEAIRSKSASLWIL